MESNENDTNTTTMVTPFSYMKNIHKPHSLSQIEKKNLIPFLDLKKFMTPFLFQWQPPSAPKKQRKQKHKIQKKGQQSETTNNQIKKYKNEISR